MFGVAPTQRLPAQAYAPDVSARVYDRLLEEAALDLFVRGRVRSRTELAARVDAVSADDLRMAFRAMLSQVPAVAVAGRVGKGLQAGQRFGELIAAGR